LLSGDSARHVTGARCPEAVSIVFAPSGDINFNEPSTCPPVIVSLSHVTATTAELRIADAANAIALGNS
jgi:hypothetical protein